jgi:hypothetical protein
LVSSPDDKAGLPSDGGTVRALANPLESRAGHRKNR